MPFPPISPTCLPKPDDSDLLAQLTKQGVVFGDKDYEVKLPAKWGLVDGSLCQYSLMVSLMDDQGWEQASIIQTATEFVMIPPPDDKRGLINLQIAIFDKGWYRAPRNEFDLYRQALNHYHELQFQLASQTELNTEFEKLRLQHIRLCKDFHTPRRFLHLTPIKLIAYTSSTVTNLQFFPPHPLPFENEPFWIDVSKDDWVSMSSKCA